MKICKRCGAQVGDQASFCQKCGFNEFVSPAKTEEATSSICPSCGRENKAGAAFCKYCGQTMKTGSQQRQAVSQQRQAVSQQRQGGSQPRPNYSPSDGGRSGGAGKIVLMIVIVVLALAVVICAGVLLFKKAKLPGKEAVRETQETIVESEGNVVQETHGGLADDEPEVQVPETAAKSAETEEYVQLRPGEDSNGGTGQTGGIVGQNGGASKPSVSADIDILRGTLRGLSADVASYVIDVDDDEYYDTGNGDTQMKASALVLIPVMYAIADGFDKHILDDSMMLEFTYTTAGRTQANARNDGQYYSIKDVLAQALRYSDNNAINTLINNFTMDSINEVCHAYGYNSVVVARCIGENNGKENYISPKDACMMLKEIYDGKFSGGIDGSFLRSYMRISDDGSKYGMSPVCRGYDTYLNLNAVIFENPNLYNEIAVVSQGGETVILCAMTNYGNYDQSQSAIGDFSREVTRQLLK